MDILMLTSVMHRVGTWYRAINLAAALTRRGHAVTVVKGGHARVMPTQAREDGVRVWTLPRFWGSSAFHRGTRMPWDIALRTAISVARRYDVVHAFTHHLNSMLPAVLAGRLSGGTLAVGDRDDLWADGGLYGDGGDGLLEKLDHRFHEWTERGMGRWFRAMTVASDDLKTRVIDNGGDPTRVRKVINGCPIDRIAPGDQAAARAVLGLPPGRAVLLFIGVGQYDVDLILDAVAILKTGHPNVPPPLTLLVGPNEDGLRALAGQRGLTDDVVTTGFVAEPQLLPYLHAADIGLLPFADKPLNHARFPIKLGDYLAAGLPVLTNDVGEMGRIVREAGAGVATAPNAAAFAAGLARMLAAGASARAEARGAARAAAERMSWDAVGGELERFYVDLGVKNTCAS